MERKTTGSGRWGGQILVDSLLAQGVDRAFCVPGESYLPVLDALYDVRDAIDLVVCRQEGGAANMADAYGKLTGRPGVCFVTRGPGAANASIGVHTAFQDSTPMVLFVGQVGRDIKDREGFQEVDFKAMFAPLAKWAAEISDARRIPEYVHRAFQTAIAGRPGPVVLALPEDVLSEVVEQAIDVGLQALPLDASPRPDQLERFAGMLQAADRPLLLIGGGGWTRQAATDIAIFAEVFDVPVATSLRCQDYLPNEHSHYIGHLAIGAESSLVARVRDCDLLIVIGARLGEMTTAGYSLVEPPRPRQRLIHFHPDPEELGRVFQADLPVNAGGTAAAAALAKLAKPSATRSRTWREEGRRDYEHSLGPLPSMDALDLALVIGEMRDRLPRDTIVASGAGNYTGWVHKYWPFSAYRSQLAPTSGAMGYGVPAAVAAKLTFPERMVVAFAGDGCFMMNGQELATAVQHDARILVIIVNNGMYGTIRMHQEREFPARVYGTDLRNPDFVTLAQAYGLHGERVTRTADFSGALDRALAHQGSALIELVVQRETISVRTTISALREKARK